MLTTKIITVGVPISVYAEKEVGEIKQILECNYNLYSNGVKNTKEYDGKIVRLALRMNVDFIEKIKASASFEKTSIINFTLNLFSYGGEIIG